MGKGVLAVRKMASLAYKHGVTASETCNLRLTDIGLKNEWVKKCNIMSGLLHCSLTGLLGAINFRTIASLCVCQGLRIIECLALRWSDLDSLDGKLGVERGIVAQQVDDVKSEESRKQLTIAPELIEALKMWKQAAQFSAAEDWKFSSPYQLGRLPWSYDQVYRLYQNAATST